jgi:hypothetical protein
MYPADAHRGLSDIIQKEHVAVGREESPGRGRDWERLRIFFPSANTLTVSFPTWLAGAPLLVEEGRVV